MRSSSVYSNVFNGDMDTVCPPKDDNEPIAKEIGSAYIPERREGEREILLPNLYILRGSPSD